MQIVGREKIAAACRKHPEWGASLRAWVRIAESAQWKNFADVRYSFSSASYVSPFVIFNIAHGKARLLTVIDYEEQLVALDSILTHAEYDQEGF
jgi:mRNA interferase HigB